MYRWCVLALLVGCEAPHDPRGESAAHRFVEPPAWPLGRVVGHIGREVAPEPVTTLELVGDDPPLRVPMPWQVPGAAARAVLSGLVGDRYAVELVEIDRRRVAWRDIKTCGAPVVGVNADVIVCADANGTHALGLDGKPAWTTPSPFLAFTGDRVVTDAGSGKVSVRDSKTGGELEQVTLPANVTPDAVIAACDRDIFAATHEGKLMRIAAKPLWSVAVGNVAALDACDGSTVLVTVNGPALLALARDTGKLIGRIDGIRGTWPARDRADRIEVATSTGVVRMSRDLSASQILALPALGALLATHGDRRLVRATPQTAVILDARGVRAFVPLAEPAAAFGDDAILAGSWLGSPAQTARLVAIPRRWRHPLRISQDPRGGLAVPSELRDLPPIVPLDPTAAVALADIGKRGVAAIALDPIEPALYAVALDDGASLARFDLATHAWSWHRGDACPPGTEIEVAASRAIVVCATHAGARATTRDGAPAWQRAGNVDSIAAAADVVVVRDAGGATVLDAATGQPIGAVATAYAAALDIGGMAIVITVEANRVVARLPRVDMVPAWSIEVHGVVRALAASGDGVVVALEDGDAYRIDARTAAISALPSIGLAWQAAGDLVTGGTGGGPVPPSPMPIAPKPKLPVVYKPVDLEAAPAIATPWPPPPPMAPSWQYTLFELDGGVRARNDYALEPPIAPATARGDGASLLIVAYGPGQRRLLVIDPVRGDPLRRIELPAEAPANVAFSTIVDGRPVAGTILADPLRVVLF
jgi:putative pyrroloquinoline-quinone binding quinoprotein